METIAFVVPRFGEEVVGGSERLILNYANLLKDRYKVEVLTSGALEYETWASYYPLGRDSTTYPGITVYRFDSKTRWPSGFSSNSWQHFSLPSPVNDQLQLGHDIRQLAYYQNAPFYNTEQFVIQQGPDCPDLYQFLTLNEHRYKRVIFTPYLYPTTYVAIDRVPAHKVSILLAAHHEPHIYFSCYRKYANYRWLVYFPEEAEMFKRAICKDNHDIIQVKPSVGEVTASREATGTSETIAFLGRASGGKGFPVALNAILDYRKATGKDLKLRVIGDIAPDAQELINNNKEAVIVHGTVSTEQRNELLLDNLALINASVLDSFGLVNLEAGRLGIPVLLNAMCPAYNALLTQYPTVFIGFNNGVRVVDAIQELYNKEKWLLRHKAILNWAYEDYSEEAAAQSIINSL